MKSSFETLSNEMNAPEMTPAAAAPGITLPRLRIWVQKGSFALVDQGLFAGANFLVNILLARWLDPTQYGAFAVAYSAFLLLTTIHTAILTEPMLVFGNGKYADCFPQYLSLLIYGHWWTTGVIALVLGLAALALWRAGGTDLAHVFVGLALASPLILLMWLVRRAFYVRGQPHWAATGGLLYLTLMGWGMYTLYRQLWLSADSALLMMGLAALAVSLWLASLLRRQRPDAGSSLTATMVLADHWGYGKWATATAALSWVSSSIFYLILPAWAGLEGSAALRAMMNLTMPLLQAYSAVSVLLLPVFVGMHRRNDHGGMWRDIRLACGGLGVTALCYWGCLVVLRQELVGWVYDGRYAEHTNLLILTGLLPILWSVTAVLGAALRAMDRIDQIFWCQVLATCAAMAVGFCLAATHGVVGAIAGGLAASATTAATMTWAVWKRDTA